VSKTDPAAIDTLKASMDALDVDLRKIRYFVAVAEQLHFRRAAEQLHIAQPALSRAIGALERELGTALLVRDSRTVSLTAAGAQLLEDARPLLATADAMRSRVQRAGRGPLELVVGIRAGLLVTPVVRAFSAERPDVTVSVRSLEWDDQEALILSGRVDVGYVRQPIDERGLRLVPLFSEPRLAALPADHRLAGQDELTLADIAGERYLRIFDPAPVPDPDGSRHRLRSVEEKLEYVAAGHGVIVLPRSATRLYSRPDIVYRALVDCEPDIVYLACEATRRSRLITAFINVAQALEREHATV
jgi:DNA-binding transcriptional LysR family regulator